MRTLRTTRTLESSWIGLAAGGLLLLTGAKAAVGQDPAVVNARTIRVTLENSRVRVLEAKLQPGEKEAMHSHPAYVVYVIAGGKIRNHGADGKVSDGELETGTSFYREPLTHWAENIGTTAIHLILVELKDDAAKAAGASTSSRE